LTLHQNSIAPPTKSRDPEVRHEKMASASKYGGLTDIPIDFGKQYLPYKTTLRQRQQAKAFSKGSYVSDVKIIKESDKRTDVKSRVYRSQRKKRATTSDSFVDLQ